MPDLRYHLISLISVFLALAVGVLLGVAMADRGVVTQGLQGQIKDVRQRLDDQNKEIDRRDKKIAALQERTRQDQAVAEGMSEGLISDSLTGLNVALVSGPFADADTTQNVQSALDTAGANFTSVTTLDEPSLLEVTGPDANPQMLYANTANEIAADDGSGPPDLIVFIGSRDGAPNTETFNDTLNTAQTSMFETWQKAGIKVIAAEPSNAKRSEIPLFKSAGVPSVDYADLAAGSAAIVQLAITDSSGAYGTKDSASEAFPVDSN